MAEGRFSSISEAAKSIINLPLTRQIILLGLLGLTIAIGYTVSSWLYQTNYRPLFSNLDNKDLATIADVLQKSAIDFKISDRDGSILVPVNKINEAKLKLAGAGITDRSTFDFAELDKTNSLGSSRFLENIRYTRALEGEMARTIMAIRGIKAARVHLALPKSSVFIGAEEKPTASVLIELSPGYHLDKSQVNAIEELVASSISGMKPSDVTVTDQYGQLLSVKNSGELALSEEQLDYQKQVQDYYEKRIQSMLTPLIGLDKVQVRVFANIDFTHEEKTQEKFNPEDKALRSEQTMNEQMSNGGSGGTPGALSNQPPDSGGTATPGAAGGGSNSKNQAIKNYEVSKATSYTRLPTGRMVNLSVAVVVDNESQADPKTNKPISTPLSAEKLSKIENLVKTAIGYDDKRGDKVSIINSPFVAPKILEVPPELPFYKQDWFQDVVEKVSAVLIALFLALGVIRPVLKNLVKGNSKSETMERGENGEMINLSPEMQRLKQQQLESLKQLASKEPTKVAGVLKNWVGDKE